MTTTTQPDARVVERVRKLLAKAGDRAVTEAEAQAFADKAAEIMEEYGLETAEIEARGGEGEARERQDSASGWGAWYKPLMEAVAESCFCSAHVLEGSGRVHFTLVGRRSAVASTRVTYEYLRGTIWRLGREARRRGEAESERFFRHGCAERVIERIRERHERVLREQREEAERREREATARAAHPGAAPRTENALVVLQQWASSEDDLNEDFLRGDPPGTTARKRAERAARAAARDALHEKLTAEGVDANVAWRVAYLDETRAEAEAAEAEAAIHRAERERRRLAGEEKSAKWTSADQRAWEREQRKRHRDEIKRASPSFRAGKAAGERIGLDVQIGKPQQKQRRVT